MSIKVTGVKQVQANLKRAQKLLQVKQAMVLRTQAELVMTKAKQSTVPVDNGILSASGVVHPVVRKGDNAEVTLSFGGAAAPYATAVHEHPSNYDPPSWRGTKVTFHPAGRGPKYLEIPLRAAEKELREKLRGLV